MSDEQTIAMPRTFWFSFPHPTISKELADFLADENRDARTWGVVTDNLIDGYMIHGVYMPLGAKVAFDVYHDEMWLYVHSHLEQAEEIATSYAIALTACFGRSPVFEED